MISSNMPVSPLPYRKGASSANYAIESALRGPDCGGWCANATVEIEGISFNSAFCAFRTLKHEITGRLRYLWYKEALECDGTVTHFPLGVAGMREIKTAICALEALCTRGPAASLLYDGAIHYIYHLVPAIRETIDDPIWGGNGLQLLVMLERTTGGQGGQNT